MGLLVGCAGALDLRAETADASDWPVPRGDAQSTGAVAHSLPQDLVVRWEFKADEAIETTPVVAGGRVFVADVMGQIYAIDQPTETRCWRRNFDTGFLASAAIRGRSVVIGDIEGNLYALDAKSGEELWKQTTDGEINGAAAFHEENVLVTSQDGKLYCFALKDGSPVWTYQTDDQIRCSPTVAGDRTFLGGCDGQLHVVDLKTGKAIGEPLPLGGPTGSTPAVRGNKAFLPIMDGAVLAFDWKPAPGIVAPRRRRASSGISQQRRGFRRPGHRQQPVQAGRCDLDRERKTKMAAHAPPACRRLAGDRRRGCLDRRHRRAAGAVVARGRHRRAMELRDPRRFPGRPGDCRRPVVDRRR